MAIKQKIKVTSVNKPDPELSASLAQVISSSQNILRLLGSAPSMGLVEKVRLSKGICDGLENGNNAAINLLIKDKAFDAYVLANVIYLMRLNSADRAQKFKDQRDALAEEIAKTENSNKKRIKKATDSRRNNSNKVEILKWFATQERLGKNLLDRDVTKLVAAKFSVKTNTASIYRKDYFAKKP